MPLRPEEVTASGLPRTPLGGVKAEAATELLKRVAWDYREALTKNQQLTEAVSELTRHAEELQARVAVLEEELARHKDQEQLARAVLATARRAALAQRNSMREDAESVLRKARLRAERIEAEARQRAEAITSAQQEAERMLARARAEAEQMVSAASTAAQAERVSLLADAQAEVEQLREEADRLETFISAKRSSLVASAQAVLGQLERSGEDLAANRFSDGTPGLDVHRPSEERATIS